MSEGILMFLKVLNNKKIDLILTSRQEQASVRSSITFSLIFVVFLGSLRQKGPSLSVADSVGTTASVFSRLSLLMARYNLTRSLLDNTFDAALLLLFLVNQITMEIKYHRLTFFFYYFVPPSSDSFRFHISFDIIIIAKK